MKNKEFTIDIDGKAVKVYIKKPNYAETKEIDLQYRKIYSEAVRMGIMTKPEALKQHAKTGTWTNDDENIIMAMQIEIVDLEDKIKGDKKLQDEDCEDIVLNLVQKRNAFLSKVNTKTELLASTAEEIATDQKIYRFVELCLRKSDGSKFFENREAYEKFMEDYPDQFSYIFKMAYYFNFNVDDDFGATWPEVIWLKNKAEESIKKHTDEQNVENVENVEAETSSENSQ